MLLFMFQVYCFDESYLRCFCLCFQVYCFDESYLRCFCLCFKCLKFLHKRKIKTVLITSISILLYSTGICFRLNFHPRSRSKISYYRRIIWLPANDDRVKYCIANTVLLVQMKLISKKFNIFPRTVFNIIGKFIAHETILCDDKDPQ